MMDTEFRQDAAWYCDSGGYQAVMEVEGKYQTFRIARVGEMRLLNRKTGAVLRTTDDLVSDGLSEDADLVDADQNPESPYEWLNNPWFELFNDDDEVEGMPVHSLQDAVDLAHEILEGRVR